MDNVSRSAGGDRSASLRGKSSDGPCQGYVLVLPGGKPTSVLPSQPWQLANLRTAALTRGLRAGLSDAAAVEQLQYRHRGWNSPDLDALRDAQWALDDARARFGDVPVVLVGHSMGGRVAARLCARANVRAVAALAPWWPEAEGDLVPLGVRLMVLHGTADRWTNPRSSREQTEQARQRGVDAEWIGLEGAGHFMMSHPRRWHRITTTFVARALGVGACHA